MDILAIFGDISRAMWRMVQEPYYLPSEIPVMFLFTYDPIQHLK
jgi:hypothetical protein